MAKTTRRRAARAARETAAAGGCLSTPTSHREAQLLLNAYDWTLATSAIDHLLRIDRPSPFMDLDLLVPQEVWLVVDLAYVRFYAGTASARVRQAVVRVVDALVKLLRLAETLRPWDDLFAAVWTRVFASDMYQNSVVVDQAWVPQVIRSMAKKGMYVAIRWHGVPLTPAQVIEPLHALVVAIVGDGLRKHVPVRLAFRFEACELTTVDLEAIHALIKVPVTTEDRLLCEPTTLSMLSFRGNALHGSHLETVSDILNDPATRRVDALCLDDVVPHNPIVPASYASSFQRMLEAALRLKDVSPLDDEGVRLSFDECEGFDSQLVETLETALLQAARPIRALSLACVNPPRFEALVRLTRLIHTPFPTATRDFELDLTRLNDRRGHEEAKQALVVSLKELVLEAVPRIQQALDGGDNRVSCRLLAIPAFQHQALNAPVAMQVFHRVRSVTQNGLFQISLGDPGSPDEAWVSATQIASIRIGEACVVGSCCARLIVDKWKHSRTRDASLPSAGWLSQMFIQAMVASFGVNLRRLSIRSFADVPILYRHFQLCPQLVDTNVENDEPYHSPHDPSRWPKLTDTIGTELQVLNIANCGLSIEWYRCLPELPHLRYLRVDQNALCSSVEGVEVMVERFQSSPRLRYLHIGSEAVFKEQEREHQERYTEIKRRTNRSLWSEFVSMKSRIAFLSAVFHLEATYQLPRSIPSDAVTTILRLAGSSTERVVVW